MRQIAIVTFCLATLSAAAWAGPLKLKSMLFENGQCKKLLVLKQDLTKTCDGKLVNSDYSDGRSGFYFITTDGLAITFSGNGNGQVKPSPDVAIQPVDMVISAANMKNSERSAHAALAIHSMARQSWSVRPRPRSAIFRGLSSATAQNLW